MNFTESIDSMTKNGNSLSDYDSYADHLFINYEDEYAKDYLFENQNITLDEIIYEELNKKNSTKKANSNFETNRDIESLEGLDDLPF